LGTQGSEYPVFWLHRGLFAVDRRKYCWLGGLDDLYDPFYLEDVDLSYRAWKVGWRCLLSLDSEVSHQHHLSIPQAGEGFLHMLVRRNEYLFFWKNVNSVSMLFKYCVKSTRRRLTRARSPKIGVVREAQSFFAALKRLPVIIFKRLALARQTVRSDREVFTVVTASDSSV
jgi:GT2 family glycosyltransferase